MPQPLSLSQQVTKTLQSLTNRPGVESTLILSRKNGSIIKVAGSLEETPEHSENGITSLGVVSPTRAVAEKAAATSIEDGDTGNAATEPDAEAGPTRAERLALEIFKFVSAASSLAASLQSTAASNGSTASYENGIGYSQSQDETGSGKADQEAHPDEVQLLRMRSKKYEVVIFPDPNFLCCVVQNMERQSR